MPKSNIAMQKKRYSAFDRPSACVNSQDTSGFKPPQMFTVIEVSGSQKCSHPVQAETLSTSCASTALFGIQKFIIPFPKSLQWLSLVGMHKEYLRQNGLGHS